VIIAAKSLSIGDIRENNINKHLHGIVFYVIIKRTESLKEDDEE